MARYRVQGPDGAIHVIEGPDNASPADVEAFASQTLGAQKPAPQQSGLRNGVEDPGALQSVGIAAGKKTDSILDGITQMYLKARGEDKALGALASKVQDKEGHYAPLREAHPVATSLGEAVPAMAVPVTGGGAALGSVVRAAGANALPELLSYGSVGDRLGHGAAAGAGGALGALGGQALARVLKPAGVGANVADDAMAAAGRIGYKPTPGQATQNPALLNVENWLSRTPGGSGRMQQAATANQNALNSAAARSMGETAGDLSEATFANAQGRIGQQFGNLEAKTKPVLGNDFMNALSKIDGENLAKGPFKSAQVDSLVDKGLDLAAKGNLSGTAYKQIRSELSNQAQSAFRSGDSTLGQALKTVRNSLDEAAESSLSAADRQAWSEARKQWAAFKTLSKGNVAEGGNVSAAKVAAQLRGKGPQLRTGQATGELADIARVGESFKTAGNPNSGNLLSTALFGNPLTGIPVAVANRLAAGAYMSRPGQAYLTRGLVDVGPEGLNLLGRTGGAGGNALARNWLGIE